MPNYVALKNTPNFTIKNYKGFSFKKWDAEAKKMLTSSTYQEGYRKMYSFELENGDILELSKDQTGQCLVSALEAGVPAKGSSFYAKDNGKQGLDKRWFINLKRDIGREEPKVEIDPNEIPDWPNG